jgi:hypothetical protein
VVEEVEGCCDSMKETRMEGGTERTEEVKASSTSYYT